MKKSAIAFYNTENFFDFTDDPKKFDNEYSPSGSLKWTQKRYENKLRKISNVISEIGKKETNWPPLFIGLAEIENEKVLKDLIYSQNLAEYNYNFIHFESLDERGIDNALLYRKSYIQPIHSEPIRMTFETDSGRIDYTRDMLYVKLRLEEKILHTFVVHLPSRRDDDVNLCFRNLLLETLRNRVDQIFEEEPNASIILMGDFNGNPNDEHAMRILKINGNPEISDTEMYNPMLKIGHGRGSLKHLGEWILFDQIIFSKSFLSTDNGNITFEKAEIYNDNSIRDWDRKFKGSPFRTYAGTKYLGGYSDHFPVYAIINY
ncbi:MAG: endonuclease [Weeksellaceae bacterium]